MRVSFFCYLCGMATYRKIPADCETINAKLVEGLNNARNFFRRVVETGTSNISTIRVCSFNIEKIHTEIRWDWQYDKLFMVMGLVDEGNSGEIPIEGFATKAIKKATEEVLEIAKDWNRTEIECSVLGD